MLIAALEVEGTSGGGMVKLVLKGTGELARVDLDESLMAPGEGEVVADLVVAAHADAKRKLDAAQADLMREAAGPLAGLNIPGMPKF
jgi:DNA-binding protein YbaB